MFFPIRNQLQKQEAPSCKNVRFLFVYVDHLFFNQFCIFLYVPYTFYLFMIDCFIVFSATYSYIMAISFSGGRSQPSTWRVLPTMGKQLVNFITYGCESNAPFLAHLAKGHVSFCHQVSSVRRHRR